MSTASKITTLNKLSCAIFGNIYNPNGLRTGNKILRERLVGPTVNSYYPNVKQIKLREITRMVPEMNLIDQSEKVRLEDLSEKKKRGKGPPKKGKAWIGATNSGDHDIFLSKKYSCDPFNTTLQVRAVAPLSRRSKRHHQSMEVVQGSTSIIINLYIKSFFIPRSLLQLLLTFQHFLVQLDQDCCSQRISFDWNGMRRHARWLKDSK